MAHSVCRAPVPQLSHHGISSSSKKIGGVWLSESPLSSGSSLHVFAVPSGRGMRRRVCASPLHAVGSEQRSASSEDRQQVAPQPSKPLQYGSRLERMMPEKDMLQKAEEEMSEKCMTLEGEEAYDCWQTVFEFEDDKASAERECILAPPGEKQQACGPLESLQTLVREGSAQGVSAVLANVRAAAKSKKARAKKVAAAQEKEPDVATGKAKKREADRAEFEVSGGRTAVAVAGVGDPRGESSEEWENQAAQAAAEGLEDRQRRATADQDDENDDFSAVRRVLRKRGLSGTWLHAENV